MILEDLAESTSRKLFYYQEFVIGGRALKPTLDRSGGGRKGIYLQKRK
jgi:hypothetical protein